MGQYDGTIRINTKIDSGGFLKGLKKMSSQSKKLNNSISEITGKIEQLQKEIKELQCTPVGDTPAISNIKNAISDTADHIENLKKQISDLSNAPLESSAISKYEDAWNKADQKYMELTRKREQLENALSTSYGPNMQFSKDSLQSLYQSSAEWKKLTAEIKKAEVEVNKYDIKLEQTQAAERLRRDNSIVKKTADLQKAINKLDVYKTKIKQTQAAEQAKRDNIIAKKVLDLQKAINKLDVYKTKLSEINGSESGIAKKLTHISDVAKGGFGNLTKHASKSNGTLNKLSGSVTRFGKRLWGLLSSVLVFSVLTKAFTALREKMAAAVKQNAQFSASMSQISANMNSAFNNLLSAAMPALNAIISAIAKATSYLSAFVALLTGKTVKSSNAAADAANNQAAAVGGVGEAAKKASEYLNGYDEMNVQASKDSSGGSGGGVGSDITYEDTDVKSQVADFLDRIKKAWEDADFTEFGRIVGDKINASLEGIDWTKIKNTSYKIGKSVATFLNGVFETPDLFTNIGKTVAESLNTAIDLAFGFADNFHWDNAGYAVADGINGFFETFGFDDAAYTIKEWIQGALDFTSALLDKTDFEMIGNKIGEFLADLDLADYLDDIADLVWQAIKDAFNLLEGIFEEAPLETSLIIAFGVLKLTGLSSTIARKISTAISTYLVENGLSLALKGVGIAVALNGFSIALTGENNLKNTIISTISSGIGTLVVTKNAEAALTVAVAVACWELGNNLYEKVPVIQEWADLIASSIVGVWDGTLSLKDVLDKTYAFELDLLAKIGNILFPDGEKFTKENVLQRIFKKVFGSDSKFDESKPITWNFMANIEAKITEFTTEIAQRIIDFTANLIDWIEDSKFGKVISGLIAMFDSSEKGKSFGNTIGDMTASFTGNEKGKGFGSTIGGMVASFTGNEKGKGFGSTIGGMVASITDKKKGKGFSSTIGSMKASLIGWKKNKKKFSNTIGSMKASLTSFTNNIATSKLVLNCTAKITKIIGNGAKNLTVLPATAKANGGVYANGKWKPVIKYASGGFPDMGQMFIARERGAELVGTLGGHTAVMNNDQIVASVAAGVFEAVTAAMANSNNGIGDINIYVGGQKITDFVIKDVKNRTISSGGKNPLLI